MIYNINLCDSWWLKLVLHVQSGGCSPLPSCNAFSRTAFVWRRGDNGGILQGIPCGKIGWMWGPHDINVTEVGIGVNEFRLCSYLKVEQCWGAGGWMNWSSSNLIQYVWCIRGSMTCMGTNGNVKNVRLSEPLQSLQFSGNAPGKLVNAWVQAET